ncbi:hypothetical protein [Rubellimicrobium arenae]|uniref:hypothetical protein n=1 Tax=Rubellimicrobium arenae TaxID=2817372 RepID=UPI001B3162E3|nr:hypothetical protein [Rubellimicrobium arenae]
MAETSKAREFIRQAQIAAKPPPLAATTNAVQVAFDSARDQAVVVGSDVISFVSGVDEETRKAISNSALLAQLVADRQVEDHSDIQAWFEAYFSVLRNIGWVVQQDEFAEYSTQDVGTDVQKAILDVAATFLGGVPGAVAVVEATLKALTSLGNDSDWITIFNRESQHARTAQFQIALARQDPEQGLLVESIAFGVEATETITTVIFFKLHEQQATLRRRTGRASINTGSLDDLAPAIREKVRAFQTSYITGLPDLGPALASQERT